MTPAEGYALARHQRPGVKIVMGATEAREERIPARAPLYGTAWGDSARTTSVKDTAATWFEYDCARLIGETRLSLWTVWMLQDVRALADRAPTPEEVAFFAARDTSLVRARAYLESLRDA